MSPDLARRMVSGNAAVARQMAMFSSIVTHSAPVIAAAETHDGAKVELAPPPPLAPPPAPLPLPVADVPPAGGELLGDRDFAGAAPVIREEPKAKVVTAGSALKLFGDLVSPADVQIVRVAAKPAKEEEVTSPLVDKIDDTAGLFGDLPSESALPDPAQPVAAVAVRQSGDQMLLDEGQEPEDLFPQAAKPVDPDDMRKAAAAAALPANTVVTDNRAPILDHINALGYAPQLRIDGNTVYITREAGIQQDTRLTPQHAAYFEREERAYQAREAAEKLETERKANRKAARKKRGFKIGKELVRAFVQTRRAYHKHIHTHLVRMHVEGLIGKAKDPYADVPVDMGYVAEGPRRGQRFDRAKRTRTLRVASLAPLDQPLIKPRHMGAMMATVLLAAASAPVASTVADAVQDQLDNGPASANLVLGQADESMLVDVNANMPGTRADDYVLPADMQSFAQTFPSALGRINLITDGGTRASFFGMRDHPILRVRNAEGRVVPRRTFHDGWDLAAPSGTALRAPASGTVSYFYERGGVSNAVTSVEEIQNMPRSFSGYGRYAVVEFDGAMEGFAMRTAHLNPFRDDDDCQIQPGARVEAGACFARSGRSGRADGPHVHQEFLMRVAEGQPYTIAIGQNHYAPFDPALIERATQEGPEGRYVDVAQLRTLVTADMGARMAERAASRVTVSRHVRVARPIIDGSAEPVEGEEIEETADTVDDDASDVEEEVAQQQSLLNQDLDAGAPVSLFGPVRPVDQAGLLPSEPSPVLGLGETAL